MATSAINSFDRAIDDSANDLYARLSNRGFRREDHSPRVIQGEFVTLAVNLAGYRVTFPSDTEPNGMAIVDLPLTCSYNTVETVAASIEGRLSVGRHQQRLNHP